MGDTDMAYVATKPCGCVTFAAVDLPGVRDRSATSRAIAAHVKAGDVVERKTVAEVRAMKWATGPKGACDCDSVNADQLALISEGGQ